jgi:hypothetical protein
MRLSNLSVDLGVSVESLRISLAKSGKMIRKV